jgi:hypothetical protein
VAVVDPSAGSHVTAATVSAATAATRADIHARIGSECEALFDTLQAASKTRLRGRADDLFKFLAHGPLFPRERLADADVNTVKDSGFRHHGSRAEPMRFIRLVLARNAVQVQQPEGRAARTRGEAGAGTVTF